VPGLAAAAAPLLSGLRDGAAAVPADAAVPAHHDFRPAQVLLHGGGVGFIDFDGAAMAEPALDLGRFRAKLRDIGISVLGLGEGPVAADRVEQNLRLLDDLCEHFLAEYLRHAEVSRDRVVLWETCDLFTAVLHAWTKVRLARIEPRLRVLVHQLRAVR
jgi:thiamine kinase-like enzyme